MHVFCLCLYTCMSFFWLFIYIYVIFRLFILHMRMSPLYMYTSLEMLYTCHIRMMLVYIHACLLFVFIYMYVFFFGCLYMCMSVSRKQYLWDIRMSPLHIYMTSFIHMYRSLLHICTSPLHIQLHIISRANTAYGIWSVISSFSNLRDSLQLLMVCRAAQYLWDIRMSLLHIYTTSFILMYRSLLHICRLFLDICRSLLDISVRL
jgi:hypothetical protein